MMTNQGYTTRQVLQDTFLDYINNYLTVDKFAEHYGISSHDATMLIMVCGSVHEAIVAEYKEGDK
jgi:hypothetical protein